MYFEYHYPLTSNAAVAFVILLVFLVIFHFTLVRRGLSRLAWKKVDYYWLALAAVGLFTEAEKVREMVVPNYKTIAEMNRSAAYADLRRSVRVYNEMPCPQFIRGDFSPSNLQRISARVCEWIGKVADALPSTMNSAIRPDLIPVPPSTGQYPDTRITVIQEGIKNYNGAVSKYDDVIEQGKPSALEATVKFLSPALLAIALALRITKVRGEIILERQSLARESVPPAAVPGVLPEPVAAVDIKPESVTTDSGASRSSPPDYPAQAG